MRLAFLLTAAALGLVSCSEQPRKRPPSALEIHPDILRERERKTLEKREAARKAEREKDAARLLVTVNGHKVLRREIYRIAGDLKDKLPPSIYEQKEHQLIRIVLRNTLIDQLLKKRDFTPSQGEIDEELDRMRRAYLQETGGTQLSFAEAMAQQGVSIQELRKTPTPGMALSAMVRRSISEEDIAELFEKDRKSFDGTRVRVSHIIVDTRSAGGAEPRNVARRKAEAFRKMAIEGADFARLASMHSDGPRKTSGGDIGFIERHGAMPEPFASAAFSLATGEISEVVETEFGYHVLRVTDIRPGVGVKLQDVRGRIVEALVRTRSAQIYNEFAAESRIEWP